MSEVFQISPTPLEWSALHHISEENPRIELSAQSKELIQVCHEYLQNKMAQQGTPVYGINTGFGALHGTQISSADMEKLQLNLLMSHACGAGREVSSVIVRWMLFLKIRSLAYGNSGVAMETVERLIAFYNEGITPVVYELGSLGASGDLAPLAHLCLPLVGLGEVWYQGKRMSGQELLALKKWQPLHLKAKEGLALLNGTQFMLAYGVHAVLEGRRQILLADRIAALSFDGFGCRKDPFAVEIHQARPHPGQIATALQFRQWFEVSPLAVKPKTQVQDPYSFRCIPQVHGATKDAMQHVANVVLTEVNSVTDNPNIFPEEDLIISGGNFHGQPLALVLDFLAIAMAELGSISERRSYLLLSGQRGLPPFLVANPGLNSGLMIAQYLAASIVNRNKQHCTPASVDTIPSSNGQEDHVSMGANAAVKLFQVIENLDVLLAIELMHASQALHFRKPEETAPVLQVWLEQFRQVVSIIEEDRVLSLDIQKATEWLRHQS
jgi:histidine ammonia-lyase